MHSTFDPHHCSIKEEITTVIKHCRKNEWESSKGTAHKMTVSHKHWKERETMFFLSPFQQITGDQTPYLGVVGFSAEKGMYQRLNLVLIRL